VYLFLLVRYMISRDWRSRFSRNKIG